MAKIPIIPKTCKHPSKAYFFRDPGIRRNLLGRSGWLDRVKLGIVDYDSKQGTLTTASHR
jgi:hypothetical protein